MDFKKKDYIAAAIHLEDRGYIPIKDITTKGIEDVLETFADIPAVHDRALDDLTTSPRKAEGRARINELYPYLKDRTDDAHTLPIIMTSEPPLPGPIVLLVERRGRTDWGELKTKIANALDDTGIKDGELFEIMIRRTSI